MIGTVLEGRHAGCAVYRLSEQNLLYIQAKDGTQVALSKKNVITIDDVTDRYPDYGKKVIMVMWEDFETSLIRLGAPRKEPAAPAPVAEKVPENCASHCGYSFVERYGLVYLGRYPAYGLQ